MFFGVVMSKNKNLFEKSTRDKGNFKYFIIAFGAFVLVLGLLSVFLFMYSIDFDFNNFVDKPEEETTESTESTTEPVYSVNSLTGKSTVLFVCAHSKDEFDFAFTVECDFNSKAMRVKCVDATSKITLNGKSLTCGEIYKNQSINELKSAFRESFEINVDKYFICDRAGAKEILSLFDGITINVAENIDYDSNDISLELNKGEQTVSGAYTLNYLLISDNSTREQIVCDIINSVLAPQYTDNSQSLFTDFVNVGETDISVIDYSESIENLKIYANAEDKFLPTTSTVRE